MPLLCSTLGWQRANLSYFLLLFTNLMMLLRYENPSYDL